MSLRDPQILERPWSIAIDQQESKVMHKKGYDLFPASKEHFQHIVQLYQQHPIKGMGIRKVEIIHNADLEKAFEARFNLLDDRFGNVAFESRWAEECKTQAEKQQRTSIMMLLDQLTKPYKDARCPHVKLMPLWHGTSHGLLESICQAGFNSLSLDRRDNFGKGFYGTAEAEHAYSAQSQGVLLVNWVAFLSAFPVIKKDMDLLRDKENYRNYDAHFAPVISVEGSKPDQAIFHPCDIEQKHRFTELVVFASAQVLPRYRVELQPELPKQLNPPVMVSAMASQEDEKEFHALSAVLSATMEALPVSPRREVNLVNIHPLFVGRKPVIDDLARLLLGKKGGSCVLLFGPAGIGKSELAVAFANLYLNHFSIVWTVEARTAQTMLQSYQSLAKQLGIAFDPLDSNELLIAAVHRFLEELPEKESFLLIFDNADKLSKIPEKGTGAVIFTSREKLSLQNIVDIAPFNDNEAMQLFERMFKKKPDPATLQIAQTLNFNPLILNQVFHYILQTPGMKKEKFLTLLKEHREVVLKSLRPAGRYL